MKKYLVSIAALILLNIGAFSQAPGKSGSSAVIPIVDMKLKGLLGGVKHGKWISEAETAAAMQQQTEFVLAGENSVSEGGVSVGVLFDPEVPCDEFYRMEFDLDSDSGIAIGSGAKWDFFPRIPKRLENNSAVYNEVVKKFLAKQKLAKSKVKIEQLFSIDLDGDKTEEIVIAATFYKNGISPSAKAGDYSFVLVRKVAAGGVEEILLEGDFVTKDIEFGAPNGYKISSIADLNGDGNMEIVVFGEYYEGSFSSVFEITGKKAEKVLGSGCGV